jgi:hypothetical protein
VRELLLVRTGPALAALVLDYLGLARAYGRLVRTQGPLWNLLLARLPESLDPAAVRSALHGLPPAPAWWRALPWLVLLAPVGVLSLWLHHSVWDHLALWLLKGRPRSVRTTLVAEAEALKVGVIGVLAALLRPLGWPFAVLLLPVAVYFWILRGYALAAWHGCPAWKGVLATLVHGALLGLMVLGLVAAVAVLLFLAAPLG